jgi:hypothetical protein
MDIYLNSFITAYLFEKPKTEMTETEYRLLVTPVWKLMNKMKA